MKGMIPERIAFFKNVDYSVVKFNEEKEKREDELRYYRSEEVRPLRPDTTGTVDKNLGDRLWEIIRGCTP